MLVTMKGEGVTMMLSESVSAYGVCIVCGMPNEPDGYCEDGCVLWVGSNEPVTVGTVGRESGVWWA